MSREEMRSRAGELLHEDAPFGRIPALDGIRGLAIAMVLLGHAYGLLPGLAAAGVGLFFVLSGFLITTILLKERERDGRISLPRFFARRALRLLPALSVLLGVATIYILVATDGATRANAVRSLWTSAAYVSNWFQAFGQPYEPALGHTWSLATEEQFYLLWPLALAAICALRRPSAFAIRVLCGGIALAMGLRAFLHVGDSPIKGGLYFSPITWADALLIGCLLGVVYSARPRRPHESGPMVIAALAVAGIAIVSGNGRLMFLGGATAMALSFAVFIWSALAGGQTARFLRVPALTGLGRISYGTYLWQGPIVWMTMQRFDDVPKALTGTGAIAASLLVAALSYRFVEQPFLRVKKRFSHATPNDEPAVLERSGALAVATVAEHSG